MTAVPNERVLTAPELGEHVLLAIDTALGTSVALGAEGRVWEASSDDPRGHAEVIGDLIARVFEVSGVSPVAVSAVVSGIGPGPFTGLRVGLAAAQAFAAGRGVPVLPIPGHEAVALAVMERDPAWSADADATDTDTDTDIDATDSDAAARADASGTLRIVQDAKRRELFVTDFAGIDAAGLPQLAVEPHLVARAEHVPPALGDAVREVWPERVPTAQLVQLAARRLTAGRDFEPDRALYLRAPDVKPAAAPKRVTP